MNNGPQEIAIIGGGMVGAAAAALFASAGFRVALVEQDAPASFDPQDPIGLRVSALSPGSQAILTAVGAWAFVESNRHCPYRRMHIEDRRGSPALEFEAPVHGLERLGTIVENNLVRAAIWRALQNNPRVNLHCPDRLAGISRDSGVVAVQLESGQRLRCSLLLGADGARSRVRRLAGLDQELWTYNQRGVVSVVRKEQPNRGVAWQRFLAGGPLAFLPLADGRSSIVWTLPATEAARLAAAPDEEFVSELSRASRGWLGEVVACGPRAAFPLDMRLSRHYVSGRIVLLGDAAHRVHPLAGQGVNLGFADAAALVETLASGWRRDSDAGLTSSLAKFERWRKSESALMALGIHAIGSLFKPEMLGPLRRLGMRAVDRSWFLKDPFIRRAAGLSRNAPALSRGRVPAEYARRGSGRENRSL